jgi:hypothetical protein
LYALRNDLQEDRRQHEAGSKGDQISQSGLAKAPGRYEKTSKEIRKRGCEPVANY